MVPRQRGLTRNPERPSVTYSLSFILKNSAFENVFFPNRFSLDVNAVQRVQQITRRKVERSSWAGGSSAFFLKGRPNRPKDEPPPREPLPKQFQSELHLP